MDKPDKVKVLCTLLIADIWASGHALLGMQLLYVLGLAYAEVPVKTGAGIGIEEEHVAARSRRRRLPFWFVFTPRSTGDNLERHMFARTCIKIYLIVDGYIVVILKTSQL